MIVLGLSILGQNPSATLLKDGVVIAFAEEERFLRIKTAFGYFPSKAIEYCLQEAGVSMRQVDVVALGWEYDKYKWRMPLFFASVWLAHSRGIGHTASTASGMRELLQKQPGAVKQYVALELKKISPGPTPDIIFVEHHLAHASTAFSCSGFTEALVVVIDGSGEEKATSIYRGSGQNLELLESVHLPHSLGWYYASFSAFLGFIPYEEDGFLMGLAPYGRYRAEYINKIQQVCSLWGDSYKVQPEYTLLGTHTYHEQFGDALVRLFGQPRLRHEPLTQDHKDLAFAVQWQLEQVLLTYITAKMQKYNQQNLCMAGGVALNVKVNGLLVEKAVAQKLYVQPVSSDAGTSLGAAIIATQQAGYQFSPDPYWPYAGPTFSKESIKRTLQNCGVKHTYVRSIAEKTAQAIDNNQIVGWFQGRMEAGPRALGNRSILANPSKRSMHTAVNARVKFRDTWRPFCPSLPYSARHTYFDYAETEGQYMIVSYAVRKSHRRAISAVVHVDRTARPQLVHSHHNTLYHRLLEHVGHLTGHPVVLNTSLNVKGEPMACTPQDALRCFFTTGMDAMAIGPYWVEK